jgi:four helix bundle protein
MGSASEVEYQLLLARDLGYLSDAAYESLNVMAVAIKRMSAGLLKKLKADR